MSDIIGTTSNFKSEVLDRQGLVLVDFWASWCGPCQMLAPVIDEIASENSNLKVVKVDVDSQPELSAQYNVVSIPTVLVFSQGQLKSTIVGFHQKEEYLKALKD